MIEAEHPKISKIVGYQKSEKDEKHSTSITKTSEFLPLTTIYII